jgi:wee1-like protein kinase
MVDSLKSEILKCKEFLKWSLAHPDAQSYSQSTASSESNLSVPINSFIKRWRSNDKFSDCKYSSSGASSPCTPTSPMRQPQSIPYRSLKQRYEPSDNEEYIFNCNPETSRYSHDFYELGEIGSGSFGRVYKCKHNLDKLFYAVKKIPIRLSTERAKEKALQEAYTLAACTSLDDTYIIKYHNAWIEKSYLYLIMELCDCSLSEYIDRVSDITETQLKKIFRDICKGLKKLHEHNIVHLDIKPENILFSFNHKFKIGDLGLARITTNIYGDIPEGDSRYLAPELMKTIPEGSDSMLDLTKADIFSLGCTVLEIMNCKPLPNNGPLWHNIRNGEFEINGNFSDGIKKLVRTMLDIDPEKRPSASKILSEFLLSDTKQQLKAAQLYIKFLEDTRTSPEDPKKRRKLSI